MDQSKLTQEQQDQLLFMMLVQQNQQIAMMGLGKTPHPSTGETEKDIKSAKYAIDTLAMLQKYTEGKLTAELKDYVANTLNELRLTYVQESKEDK